MKIFNILLLCLSTVLMSFSANAQVIAPEQINVTSIEINKVGNAGTIAFRMKAVNAAQTSVEYFGADSAPFVGNISYIQGCNPCSPPKVFNTNVFQNNSAAPNVIYAGLGTGAGSIKIYLTSSDSSPMFINQRIFSKKRNFFLKGSAKITGRVEVYNSSGLQIAADEQVELTGSYSIEFSKSYISPTGRRQIDFKSLTYFLEN